MTLPGLFQRRIERTPDGSAYRQYDPVAEKWVSFNWRQAGRLVGQWQRALEQEHLAPGERVAILLKNCMEWVCFDQAALSLGLVVAPLYPADNPDNIAYILADSGARLLLLDTAEQWQTLAPHCAGLPALRKVLHLQRPLTETTSAASAAQCAADWLSQPAAANPAGAEMFNRATDPHALATIVYTSGTTGRPKGVMLSHHNILWNAEAVLKAIPGYREDVYLSFLPLSHTFERTVGYYIPVMAGSCVAYARSVKDLPEDLSFIRPTMLIAVPRIFERVHAKIQQQLEEKGALAGLLFRWTADIGWRRFEAMRGRGRARVLDRLLWPVLRHLVANKILSRFGGRLRLAVSGGAPLYGKIYRCFIGLGLPLVQGYGLTEAAPVVTGNRLENAVPDSVGEPLPGIEIKVGAQDELLVRAPCVMQGYWNQPEATRAAVDQDGWLHTGDQARIVNRHVFILGRLKEILVTSTGEKVPPADLEMAITQDPLFDQAMILGEGKPYLSALLVLNRPAWDKLAENLGLRADAPESLTAPAALRAALGRVEASLHGFPGYARVRAVHLSLASWTIENGLLTPTLKLKRPEMEKRFASKIAGLYAGHE